MGKSICPLCLLRSLLHQLQFSFPLSPLFSANFLVFDRSDQLLSIFCLAQVALKVINISQMEKTFARMNVPRAKLIKAVRREISIVSGLSHPYIVSLLHSFSDEEMFYLAMELVNGNDAIDLLPRVCSFSFVWLCLFGVLCVSIRISVFGDFSHSHPSSTTTERIQ